MKLSRDRIAELPVNARVAFAAACARRSLDALLATLEQSERKRLLEDLGTAVSVVERFVAGRKAAENPFKTNGRVIEILVRLRADEELAGHVCSVISEALLAQSASMAHRDEGITQAASQAAQIAGSILGEGAVAEILDRLLTLAKQQAWTDESQIDLAAI